MVMTVGSRLTPAVPQGLWRIEDVLDAEGNIALPPDITLISLIERNVANVGDTVAYRTWTTPVQSVGSPTN